jgi:biotin carboxyl carrier protein
VKFEIEIQGSGAAGRKRKVELERNEKSWAIRLDGKPVEADVAQITQYTFSILLHGRSHELCLTPQPDGSFKIEDGEQELAVRVADPRAWRGRSSDLQAAGRQNIVAPMPGKVVRVLVKAGDAVEAGQGLLVVEAMKMQNELRSPKRGVVQRLSVSEGEPVNAGQVLLSVE